VIEEENEDAEEHLAYMETESVHKRTVARMDTVQEMPRGFHSVLDVMGTEKDK